MADEDETRAEEMERLEEEIEHREARLRRLRLEDHREDGMTLEECEGLSSGERRQLKEDDPELWDALMTEKREQGEEALGADRGPLAGRRR